MKRLSIGFKKWRVNGRSVRGQTRSGTQVIDHWLKSFNGLIDKEISISILFETVVPSTAKLGSEHGSFDRRESSTKNIDTWAANN
jgi:hypothetical protein